VGITKLSKSGFTASSYQKYDDFLAGNTAFNPSSYESIATVTVGSGGAANVEFTSISSDYTHLQIRGIGRSTSTECDIKVQFNSDTGSNYSYHRLQGNGSTTGADGSGSQTTMFYCGRIDASTSVFGATIIDILDYKNTNKYKTLRALMGFDANGSGYSSLGSGMWMNTNAVTSIKLIPHAGNFAQYSEFSLYGIRGA
jgi:hypothetical protein